MIKFSSSPQMFNSIPFCSCKGRWFKPVALTEMQEDTGPFRASMIIIQYSILMPAINFELWTPQSLAGWDRGELKPKIFGRHLFAYPAYYHCSSSLSDYYQLSFFLKVSVPSRQMARFFSCPFKQELTSTRVWSWKSSWFSLGFF